MSGAALPRGTNYTPELIQAALVCLKRCYREDYAYRKAGVVLLELAPEEPVQAHLFLRHDPRQKALMEAVDEINRKLGRDAVYVATRGRVQGWAMRREMMSPRYTTHWQELPLAKALPRLEAVQESCEK